MSARNHGERDANVLRHLRQFGLHPAVRVFENRVARNWTEEAIRRVVMRTADRRRTLRLVIGSRTA
jgi:hypothetical protein